MAGYRLHGRLKSCDIDLEPSGVEARGSPHATGSILGVDAKQPVDLLRSGSHVGRDG